MRFVPQKSVEQQDLQCIRVRCRLVGCRTQLINQVRGPLAEFGIVLLAELDEKIAAADNRIQVAFQNTPRCQQIATVEGVGPLIATAVVAPSATDAFENGRQFSAWLGLVHGRTPAVARAGLWN